MNSLPSDTVRADLLYSTGTLK